MKKLDFEGWKAVVEVIGIMALTLSMCSELIGENIRYFVAIFMVLIIYSAYKMIQTKIN